MILSDLSPRGTLHGVIFRGGGGGVSDYDDLTNRPKINNITLTGNQSASDLGLADPSDIKFTGINQAAGWSIYRARNITVEGLVYDVAYPEFTGTDGVDPGTNGLVKCPEPSDYGKFLASSGNWETISSNAIDYNTNEQNIGIKWINNKDIYQKTIILKTGSVDQYTYSNSEYIDCLPHGIDYINIINMYANRSGSDYIDVWPNTNEVVIVPNISTHNLYMRSDHNPTEIMITIQYTKS